jgi:hypothetical protein
LPDVTQQARGGERDSDRQHTAFAACRWSRPAKLLTAAITGFRKSQNLGHTRKYPPGLVMAASLTTAGSVAHVTSLRPEPARKIRV